MLSAAVVTGALLGLTQSLFAMHDGWMDDLRFFMSLPTVFLSYQDDGQMIMKGCVQWDPI